MKKILLFSLAVTASSLQAQSFNFLDANLIKARINCSRPLFEDPFSETGFEFPSGSGNTTMYSASLMIGARNAMGTIYASTHWDMQPGPLQDGTAAPSTNAMAWDRLWKLSLDQINYHRMHYNDVGYTPITDIAEWPAHGSSLYNEPANIAPFADENNNGIYEPLLGDYPLIKGTQAIFFVQNDKGPDGPGEIPLGLEIQCMAYVFDCAGNAALDHTVFVNYKFINKSSMTYQDAYAGLFADVDLGYYLDDYAGCNVSKGMFYMYNADAYDEPYMAHTNYGYNLPVQGVTLLAGPWQDADGNDNPVVADLNAASSSNGIVYSAMGKGFGDGFADNERLGMTSFMAYTGAGAPNPNMSDPDNGAQAYNFLTGRWRDGSPSHFGGSGYPGLWGVDTITTSYLFFGDSDPLYLATSGITVPNNWTEVNAGNIPGDRRGVCGSGPFTIQPGEANEIDFAFTVAQDLSGAGTPLSALPTLYSYTDAVRHYFNNNISPCGEFYSAINENTESIPAFGIYPNPVNHVLNIGLENAVDGTGYKIQDIYGKVVISGTIQSSRSSVDVSLLQEGVYLFSVSGKGAQKFVVQH